MKYSLYIRQPKSLLSKADEIYLYYDNDFKVFEEYLELFPKKMFLVIFSEQSDGIDFDFIKTCANKFQIECECFTMDQMLQCGARLIPYCLNKPIESFLELNTMKALGATSIYLGPELFFSFNKVQKKDIRVRFIPNVVNNNVLRPRHENNINSAWIRPEDIELYSGENNICRFYVWDKSFNIQEEAFFNVYTSGCWQGPLESVVYGVKSRAPSAGFESGFGRQRISCGNKCQQKPNFCRYCEMCNKLALTLKASAKPLC